MSVLDILSAVPTSASSTTTSTTVQTGTVATDEPAPARCVLAVPVDKIPPWMMVQGFKPGDGASCEVWRAFHASAFLCWPEKSRAETDPAFKQIIPYVILESVDGNVSRFLTYERRTGDGRLTGLKSVGVGGHIEREDEALAEFGIHATETIRNAIQRELSEELGISQIEAGIITGGAVPIGIINDDSTPVGQVHVGVVYRARIHAEEIGKIHGSDEVLPVWKTETEIAAELEQYEKWSQGVIGALIGGVLDMF